jgi:hypothetical protein
MLKRGLGWAWGVALIALLLTASCSGDKAPRRGELIVAFQTDLSIPKDINFLVVSIYAGGSKRYQSVFPLSPDGKFHLPATLAIIEGEQKNQAVTVRVTGLDKAQQPQVIRQAVSTVPKERIALMHMPIQFLCMQKVTPSSDVDGTENYDDDCTSKEQTCISGECVPDEVDVNTLPTYAGDLVFGGVNFPGLAGGQCLDVLGCFAKGATVAPDQDCSVPLPGGSEENVNVGLVLPLGGKGICGTEACIVALERDDQLGWKFENGRAILPKKICERLGDDIDALAVTSACVTKTTAIPTCGPWTSIVGDFTTDAGAPAEGGSGEGGIDDPCANAEDGVYCNWENVIGQGGELVRECKGGVTVQTTDCQATGEICIDGGPSEFAYCGVLADGGVDGGKDAGPPGPCAAKPDGYYCDVSALVECKNQSTALSTPCATGCTQSGGQSFCNVPNAPLELGRMCGSDGDCGGNLKCIKTTGGLPSGGGVAYGLCTLACTPGQAACGAVKPGAGCHTLEPGASYCLEGCNPTDQLKCNARTYEMACASLLDQGTNTQKTMCLPACSNDIDCDSFTEGGPPGYCSLKTGLCQTSKAQAANIGASCTSGANCTDSICSKFTWGPSGTTTDSCSAGCSLGNFCQFDPLSQTPPMMAGACLWPADPANPTFGNLGQCMELCGCQFSGSTVCSNPAFQCNSLTDSSTPTWVQKAMPGFGEALGSGHQAEGYCGPPFAPDGTPITNFILGC